RYLHWSILVISEANLVLIAVMVVIFGAALLIPFPGHHGPRRSALPEMDQGGYEDAVDPTHRPSPRSDLGNDADAAMWTSRVRRGVLRQLPPGKMLPDRQPAYVAPWIYVFGVASMATLALVIVSGIVIAV